MNTLARILLSFTASMVCGISWGLCGSESLQARILCVSPFALLATITFGVYMILMHRRKLDATSQQTCN